jgi:hypothetical protein
MAYNPFTNRLLQTDPLQAALESRAGRLFQQEQSEIPPSGQHALVPPVANEEAQRIIDTRQQAAEAIMQQYGLPLPATSDSQRRIPQLPPSPQPWEDTGHSLVTETPGYPGQTLGPVTAAQTQVPGSAVPPAAQPAAVEAGAAVEPLPAPWEGTDHSLVTGTPGFLNPNAVPPVPSVEKNPVSSHSLKEPGVIF